MRKLEDLKGDILNGNIDKFYVFYGEDIGIRKHYIDKLSTYFEEKVIADTCNEIKPIVTANSLFQVKQLIIIYNDNDFANQKINDINDFVERIKINFTCILVYDDPKFDTTNLYKTCSDYCTEFQAVQSNIAKEFVESELDGLTDECEEDLAFNCYNYYNNILLEADKIKQYQAGKNLSQQGAYNALLSKNQLLYRNIEFSSRDFMNSVLLVNYTQLANWYSIIKCEENEGKFFNYLSYMYNDFLIAGLCKKYGKYDGGSRAYNYTLPWSRVVEIRDFDLIFDATYYFERAYKVAEVDSMVKNGKLDKSKSVDYFYATII